MKVNVADTIQLQEFSFNNPQGGTQLSDWCKDDLPNPILNVIVIRQWHDYETGQRGWGLIKEIALGNKDTYENYEYFLKNAMGVHESIDKIIEFTKEQTHLPELELQEHLGELEAIKNWGTADAFKDNFLIYFSEWNVLSVEHPANPFS